MIPHIMLVEADLAIAQVTSAILLRAIPDAIVAIESDFAAAQRSMRNHPPDVLIIDPVLHRRESIELVQQAKTEHLDARVIVIVIASTPTPALRREMEGLGIDAYLEKPMLLLLQIEQLLAALRPVAPANTAIVK